MNLALNEAEPGGIVITFFEEYDPLFRLIKDRVNANVPEDMLA